MVVGPLRRVSPWRPTGCPKADPWEVRRGCTAHRRADGVAYGVELDRDQAAEALRESVEIEAQVGGAAHRCLCGGLRETDSAYSPFAPVAEELGYEGDPTLEPSPFFTSLHGYRTQFTQKS